MRTTDIIKFYILEDSTWVEHTDGLLTVNINRGLKEYTSPTDMPDAGIMVLTSRSYSLDPYENSSVRTGRKVKVEANGTPIFTGRLIDVNVSYQPKGNPPEINLVAIDMIGTMQAHTLSDFFRGRLGSAMYVDGFYQEIGYASVPGPNSEVIGLEIASEMSGIGPVYEYSTFGPLSWPASGSSLWDFFRVYPQSTLAFPWANVNDQLETIDDWSVLGASHPRENPPVATFDSRGGELGYYNVVLGDGFDNLCNKMKITGVVSPLSPSAPGASIGKQVKGTVSNTVSNEEWGPGFKDFTVNIASNTAAIIDPGLANFANRVFMETVHPSRDIRSISWNGRFDPDLAKTIEIYDNVQVYHEIDTFTIDKKYQIVGITHNIDADNWNITYSLKNAFLDQESIGFPTIVYTPETIDTRTDITFSIDCERPENIAQIVWNDGDGQIITGPTITNEYRTQATYTITASITDVYGIIREVELDLFVPGALPTSDFSWRANSSNSGLIEFLYLGETIPSNTVPGNEFVWNFGSGVPSNNSNLKPYTGHIYTSGGSKTVSLTVTNQYGTSTTTKTISVTPGTVTNQVGTRPVRFIRLRVNPGGSANASAAWFPLMSNLQALTSSGTNRLVAASDPVISRIFNGSQYLVVNNGQIIATPALGNPYLTSVGYTTPYGVRPVSTAGVVNRLLYFVLDLGDVYYDIDLLKISLEQFAADNDYPNLDIDFQEDVVNYVPGVLEVETGWTFAGRTNATVLGLNKEFSNASNLPVNW
jgi:PKD repeat protein